MVSSVYGYTVINVIRNINTFMFYKQLPVAIGSSLGTRRVILAGYDQGSTSLSSGWWSHQVHKRTVTPWPDRVVVVHKGTVTPFQTKDLNNASLGFGCAIVEKPQHIGAQAWFGVAETKPQA